MLLVRDADQDALDRFRFIIRHRPKLPERRERVLFARIRHGDQGSFDEVMSAHLGDIAPVALEMQTPELDLEDLLGAGCTGLLRAGRTFDERRSIQFAAYAEWWIRSAIIDRIVEPPLLRQARYDTLDRQRALVQQRLEARRVDSADLSSLRVTFQGFSMEQDSDWSETLANALMETAYHRTFDVALAPALEEVPSVIGKRDSWVLRLAFGLDGRERMTVDEMAVLLRMRPGDVLERRNRALSHLCRLSREHVLLTFLG